MRLHEIQENDDAALWKEHLWPMLQRDCSQFIDVAFRRGGLRRLYRGIKMTQAQPSLATVGPDAYLTQSPINRKPRDTNPEQQQIIDRWLAEHGFKALRHNSAFTTGSRSWTEDYGEGFIVFPVDGFKFTWFMGTEDFWGFTERQFNASYELKRDEWDTIARLPHEDYQTVKTHWLSENIDRLMKKAAPSKENLVMAIDSNHEIMIHGSYYLFGEKRWDSHIYRTFQLPKARPAR
jgi:hypothetical protein